MAQRENTKNPIPSSTMADLNDNTIILDEWTNSNAAYTTDRFGNPILTLSKILSNYQAAVNDIQSGSFLPISGGTVTGDTNFTAALKYKGNVVFTVNGGTVTGTTNFTETLKYKGVEVLKTGDCGLGGVSKTVLSQSIADNSGFYKYTSTSTGMSIPVSWTKYGTFIKSSWANNNVQSTFIMQDLTQLKAAIGYVSSSGDIKTAEIITTENISSYQSGSVTLLYPNGTSSAPATIGTSQRVVISNPYASENCVVKIELLITNSDGTQVWAEPSVGAGLTASNKYTGVSAKVYGSSSIVIQSARDYLTEVPSSDCTPWDRTGYVTSAQYRIRVFKIGA